MDVKYGLKALLGEAKEDTKLFNCVGGALSVPLVLD